MLLIFKVTLSITKKSNWSYDKKKKKKTWNVWAGSSHPWRLTIVKQPLPTPLSTTTFEKKKKPSLQTLKAKSKRRLLHHWPGSFYLFVA